MTKASRSKHASITVPNARVIAMVPHRDGARALVEDVVAGLGIRGWGACYINPHAPRVASSNGTSEALQAWFLRDLKGGGVAVPKRECPRG